MYVYDSFVFVVRVFKGWLGFFLFVYFVFELLFVEGFKVSFFVLVVGLEV